MKKKITKFQNSKKVKESQGELEQLTQKKRKKKMN